MSRRRLIIASALTAFALVTGVLTDQWILRPETDDPATADAIFVLGGGGERVEYALDLTRQGVATDVVFASAYVAAEGVWAAGPCNSRRPVDVPAAAIFRCVEPDPDTTRGEARLLRDLAESEGWETVVVVASTDQITRARRLIGRCWDGDVRVVGPAHTDPWPIRVIYEWGAGVKATIVRGC